MGVAPARTVHPPLGVHVYRKDYPPQPTRLALTHTRSRLDPPSSAQVAELLESIQKGSKNR